MPDVSLSHQSPIIRTQSSQALDFPMPKNGTQHSASTLLVSHSLLTTASLTKTNKTQMPFPFPVSGRAGPREFSNAICAAPLPF